MTQTETHELTVEVGTKDYLHGTVLPYAELACSCGGWARAVHSWDAGDETSGTRREVADDFAVHVAMDASEVRWPTTGGGLHELLSDGAYGATDRTTGEYRTHKVPKEATTLRTGTTRAEVIAAIAALQDELDDVWTEDGVPLAYAPKVAALGALTEQLKQWYVQVQCWKVVRKSPGWRDGIYSAWHTQAEAEIAAARLTEKYIRPHSTEVFVAEFGPAPVHYLYLPGATPARG